MRSYKRKPRYTNQRYLNTSSIFRFDGVDDVISLDNKLGYNFKREFSITCKVKILGFGNSATSSDDNRTIVTKGPYIFSDVSNPDNSYFVGFNVGGGKFTFVVKEAITLIPVSMFIETNHSFELNKTYHIAFVYKGGEYMKIYVNGVEVGIKTENVPLELHQTAEPVYIGYNPTQNSYSNIELSHLKLFNKAITSDEVHTLKVWGGTVPKSGIKPIVDYLSLSYNSFLSNSVFRHRDPSNIILV